MRVDHIERRVGEQMILIESISSAYENLIRPGLGNISRQRIETRLDARTDDGKKFRINDTAIQIAIDKLERAERRTLNALPYFKENLYAETQDHYRETVEKIRTLISQQQDRDLTSRASTASGPTISTAANHHDPRLPRINLSRYDGTHQDWLSFRDLFSSIVVANQSITATEKLQYLKSCLRGPAAQLLDTTTVTADNFYQAWESLKSFHDSRRILVGSTLDSFVAIKEIKHESGKELERLYTSMTQVYRTLKTLKRPVEHWDDILVYIIVRQKLDSKSIRAWEQHVGSSDEPPTWKKLQSFIISRSRTLRAIENSQGKKSFSSRALRPAVKSRFTSHHNNREENAGTEPCRVCSGHHKVSRCPTYQQKTVEQQNHFVKENKLCFNCLGPHQMSRCRSTLRCQICGRKHHSSLHEKRSSKPSTSNESSTSESTPKQVNHLYSTSVTIILATSQVKVSNPVGKSMHVRALLDQGSKISLISEKLAQQLHLQRKSSSLPIIGIGAQKSGKTKGIASVIIQPHFKSIFKYTLNVHILSKLTLTIPASRTHPTKWTHTEGLLLADPNFTEPGNIDLIIGADVYGALLENKIAQGPPYSPTAQSTKLGWIISGPTTNTPNVNNVASNHCSIDHELYNLLEKFWHQEEVRSSNRTLSAEDEACEAVFKTTHSRNPNQANTLSDYHSNLTSTNLELHSTQQHESFTEYDQLGHMVRLPINTPPSHPAFYLPHHGVKRESSTTTKLRVVFNGSCKTTDGQPINSLLHSGPKLQLDLFNILVWLRQHRYLFSADIEKMYRQIQVHRDNWKLERILWKEDGRIITFQLTTVTYGLACAPYLALRSVKQLIEDKGKHYPAAVETLTIKEIPDNHKVSTVDVPFQEQSAHALGLLWNPSEDHLHFKFPTQQPAKFTKRSVLSKIAQLFDPLGLLSPIFITTKISMQELWVIKLQWDNELPSDQHRTWPSILKSLEGLDTIAIPRWLGTLSTSTIEIHGFCDASQLAMSAVVYCLTRNSTNEVTTSILCSKTKVAPLKRLTIPRLELSAAVLLTKLTSQCIDIL